MPAASEAFRPRLLRPLTQVLAVVVLIAFIVLATAVAALEWRAWHSWDAIWMIGIGVLFAAGLWRLGAVAAFADSESLRVRNILGTRRVDWDEIVGITFSADGGQPWPLLDLADGTTLPVMGIQSADGPAGYAACERLRRLVDTHSTPADDDG